MKNKHSTLKYFKRYYELYIMLLPLAVLFVVFRIYPLYGLTAAFKDYNIFTGLSESPWVGLKWFRSLFDHPDFYKILRNTLVIGFLDIAFSFPACIIFALLLNEMHHIRFKKFVQSVSYLPHFLSWSIVGGLVIQMLQPSSGIIRFVYQWFDIPSNRMLLLEKSSFYPILIIATIWKGVGWGSIMYLAALSGIDPTLYEAAVVDGASRLQRVRYITLPGLSFIIALQLVLAVGNILGVGFERIYILASDLVYDIADVFATYNYRVGIGKQRYSFNAALGLFESVVGFVLVMFANKVAKLLGHDIF